MKGIVEAAWQPYKKLAEMDGSTTNIDIEMAFWAGYAGAMMGLLDAIQAEGIPADKLPPKIYAFMMKIMAEINPSNPDHPVARYGRESSN